MSYQVYFLAKYISDFTEIRGIPFLFATFWGSRSSEVVIIWPDTLDATAFPQFYEASIKGTQCDNLGQCVSECGVED